MIVALFFLPDPEGNTFSSYGMWATTLKEAFGRVKAMFPSLPQEPAEYLTTAVAMPCYEVKFTKDHRNPDRPLIDTL